MAINLFEDVINEDVIDSLTIDELNLLNTMLESAGY